MRRGEDFFNLYNHDLIRVAVAVPRVKMADPAWNVRQAIALAGQAAERRAVAVLFPELGLSAYSCEDLFQQRALLDACQDALGAILAASTAWPLLGVVGMPLAVDQHLYNCAVVFARGRVVGVVPKTYLPNYRRIESGAGVTPAPFSFRVSSGRRRGGRRRAAAGEAWPGP